jgi:acetyl esterase/lipase
MKRSPRKEHGFVPLTSAVLFALATTFGAACLAGPVGEPLVYKTVDQRPLRLFVVKPSDWKPADARPAIVFFHGGGWRGGAPGQFNRQAEYLASRGMVCLLAEYRLLRDDPGPPLRCIRDAKSAMRWVRSHASELGIDPERIAAGGGSAGGHLAAFVGMVEGLDDPQDDLQVSPRADALVLFNPVFDNGPQDGYGHGRVGERYKEWLFRDFRGYCRIPGEPTA